LFYILVYLSLTIISAHFSYRYIEVPGRRWFKPRAAAIAPVAESNR
jgi:peptidoglycan/LPS O-acetylase OafA/YrhL